MDETQPSDLLLRQNNLYKANLWIAENVLRQSGDASFRLLPSHLTTLHKIIMDGLLEKKKTGRFRDGGVTINGSLHVPPIHQEVPRHVEELCRLLHEKWRGWSVTSIGAYTLWKMNWIHPFFNGNGRTSRLLSYFLMCMKAGYLFRGRKTVIQQLEQQQYRRDYIQSLQKADKGYRETQNPDLASMEKLLTIMLIEQLKS